MQPLSLAQQVLPWICMSPLRETTSKSKILAYRISIIVFFIMKLNAIAAGGAYVCKFISTDLEGSVFAFSMTLGVVGVTYMMIVLICSREKVSSIFEQLTKIYKACKCQHKLTHCNPKLTRTNHNFFEFRSKWRVVWIFVASEWEKRVVLEDFH